ncbi:hypothetical protein BO94DRAFT_584878 [Aspergillus sclerotioniger CBS 115572]|uniref:Uncharacterized protein n=1 Tax=Aspergillus sclerotioniger CBS 115572 TaxID=1450535 RepID=A0A317WTA5_9EURO|nr:hypothetical protein BO94DRAFT_584878 [Aspergillus sclerotioniger CBS 115572]PWY89634.1 hypothetical protein BO94DRAFT_584878 [Aspergillus sclerotioniger CBS 115572]
MATSEKEKLGFTVEVEQAEGPPDQRTSPKAQDLVEEVPDMQDSPSLIETIGYLLSIQDGYGPPDSTWDVDDWD